MKWSIKRPTRHIELLLLAQVREKAAQLASTISDFTVSPATPLRYHGRPRRGLGQAPSLPLLRRRRRCATPTNSFPTCILSRFVCSANCYFVTPILLCSDLHQGHQHLSGLRAPKGGIRCRCRRWSSVVSFGDGRARSGKRRRRHETLILEEARLRALGLLGFCSLDWRIYCLWFSFMYRIAWHEAIRIRNLLFPHVDAAAWAWAW